MKWSLFAMIAGFIIDLFAGDPHNIPHPIVLIGKLIAALEKAARRVFPKTRNGERAAGAVLWLVCVCICFAVPALILWGCNAVSPWLRLVVESIMCWQILAAKTLKDESMKVYYALCRDGLEKARYAVSMIVGRDTEKLDREGVIKAAVETVAENTSDAVIAPLLFLAIGGAPLGFFYKAVNTMDSMLGNTDPPYDNIGLVPARADDVLNFIPSRLSAVLLIAGGWILNVFGGRKSYDIKNGWKIFKRDRKNHASPNSGQTEAACAGLLGVQLAGDAWYHGILHKKKYIGDPLKKVRLKNIPDTCRLMYAASVIALVIFVLIRAIIVF